MSRQWTENQKLAIDARKGSLLVSAAAGSGKTAVLVERVVLMVTDSENPVPIERLLIVTYTRAAAAELKERISKTLGKLISEHPDNKWYRRQLMYLPRAHISTVDSFCGDIVREFFQEIDAPSDYRIADNNELAIYVEDAFDKTLEHFYAEGSADFSRLIETFTTVKTDRNLKDIVKSLYDFLRSHPFEEMWLDEKLKFYTEFTGASESVWGKVIIDYAISAAEYCIDLTNASLKILEQDAELYSLSSALFLADLQYLEILHKKLVSFDNWDAISRFADSFVSGRFDAKGYKDHPFKLRAASNRNLVKATIGKIQSLFTKREDEIIKEVYSQSGIVKKMFECLVTFKEYYSQCKLSKNIADFSDIVHWTLSLLVKCNEEGNFEFTGIADTISERFDAVMVDEFQDANEVQDLIFKAVSHGGTNLFIVGDVKQSIYGFRQAMPEIFLNRKNSLPLYSRELDNYPSKVILESNFRSRSEVTDFINFVFTTIMSTAVGDMEYTKEEHLIPKAPYTPADTPCTELHLLDLDSIGEI
ncbi:MAG: UvrD-helicase domain-containing protein, partial [Ruminococcus sp.]|nr:UvrD-helicase domain-containing protein [Ruminococcus sp.]